MKVGDYVFIYYWDHTSSVNDPSPAIGIAPGWVYRIDNKKPAHIVLAHGSSHCGDDEPTFDIPFTTILKSDIITVFQTKVPK